MDILQNNKPGAWLQKITNLDNWISLFLSLYLLTIPFVSAFAYTQIVTFPLVFSTILFCLMVINILKTFSLPNGFIGLDIIIIFLFLFLVILSFLLNGFGDAKSFNHTVAYLSTFLLFYVTVKYSFFNAKDKRKLFLKVLRLITYVTIISALFANLEFMFANLFNINLNDYVPRPTESEAYYNATVLGIFYRARGFAPESGHFAFMLELISPLAIYYLYFSHACNWSKLTKALIVIAVVLSIIFTVSTASFVLIPIAFVMALLFYMKSFIQYVKRNTKKFLFTTGIIAIIVALFNYFLSFYALIILSITDKLDSNSFDDRQARINFFYERFFNLDIVHKLIGTGPAGYTLLGFDETNTILSLYYSLTFELGYLGLFLFSTYLLYVFWNSVTIKSKLGFFLLISIFSGMMHYNFIENFWYPWFWTVAAFAVFCHKYYLEDTNQIDQTKFSHSH
ncbi:MAG: O-antigen ligase family protein [Ginsengibacter sp.]